MPDPTPTPEDLARDLAADLGYSDRCAEECEPIQAVYAARGWPAAIRRALAAEAELARLRQRDDAMCKGDWLLGTACGQCPRCRDSAREAIAHLRGERDKLAAFKAWTHAYLDAQGVPHHPPGPHGAEGCRVGDRMDWLMTWARGLEGERDRLRAILDAPVTALFTDGRAPTTNERHLLNLLSRREKEAAEAKAELARRDRRDLAMLALASGGLSGQPTTGALLEIIRIVEQGD